MHPLVSIIITTHNSARTLARCLGSVKEQTYPNIELIVVDNNSSDKTTEIARKFTDQVYSYGPERSAQRNFGARQAKGRYLLIHDSDIYFPPTAVAECVELVETKEATAVILPEMSIGEGFWTKVKAFERSFYVGNDYIEAARFFDASLYKKLGGYDEKMYAAEDWDLTIRLREAGSKIFRSNSFLLHDEGRLNLFGSSIKKKYYAENFYQFYAKKHPAWCRKQMSFFARFKPKPLFLALFTHPIKLGSMIIMKGFEFISTFNA